MRPLRVIPEVTPPCGGIRDAAKLMTEDWRSARRVSFAIWKFLLAVLLQHCLANARLRKNLVEGGVFAQVFKQRIV